ncbi:gluconate 2-dehydrogenase subunit 3 family protein [Siculibacillus lacustris]|uniref:Gluconate 2-dehydrogenase subunit 3 family protein n=1 Tax=Siculibacillus lacustris TaxID=1549641 RepID=A0A4Q9VSH0_9HYPH|nr:gluconate 2-dehydrogenase subunit 3 family protein [Siculibacillus lacustris]TBW38961.1 gluconate 2-dehydrogenase subunit 3 family protein [Siculibacillus lacustris]
MSTPTSPTRRRVLSTAAWLAASSIPGVAFARSISGALPWDANSAAPPPKLQLNGWFFFTSAEVETVTAIVDRLIPADALSPSGAECGVVVYIDRQMIGPFGRSSRLYTQGPFFLGTPRQGWQSPDTPAQRWRAGVAALERWVAANRTGRRFAALAAEEKDAVLKDVEAGKIDLGAGVDAKAFFALVLQNTMEGFFADPAYGGNKDMASWRMLGFPGARYDYRDHVDKHGQRYPLPPVSITGRPEWAGKVD